jgi:hypothetical protein
VERRPSGATKFVPGGIFIRQLPQAVTDAALRDTLGKYARVVRLSRRVENGLAWVELEDPDVAEKLIAGRHGALKFAGISQPMPWEFLKPLQYNRVPSDFRSKVDQHLRRGGSGGGRWGTSSNDGEVSGGARASPGAHTAETPRAPQPSASNGERSTASAGGARRQGGGTEQADGDSCCELGSAGVSVGVPVASLQSPAVSTLPRCRQLLGVTVTETSYPLPRRPAFPLLWEGVLDADSEVMNAGARIRPRVRRAWVRARHVFGENLDVLLMLENVLGRQKEWGLQGGVGVEGKSSAASGVLHDRERDAARARAGHAPDECQKALERAARAGALVLCLLERDDTHSEWLDDHYYSLKLPAGAKFCAAVVPAQSQVCLGGFAEPLLASWLP